MIADLAHVAWAVNLGCLGFHVWPVARRRSRPRRRAAHRPRPHARHRLRGRARGRRASRTTCSTSSASSGSRRRRASTASTCTSGSRRSGIRSRCGARPSPSRASSRVAIPTSSPTRGGRKSAGERIFVDFNQNAPHKTVFGAWCVRARPGAQVSTPFAWDELETIDPDAQTIASVPGRVAERGDPWAEIDTAPAVDRAAARALRPRHRERHDRRALAARVPEDAGRAAPGGAQPGQEAEAPIAGNKSLASYIAE